MLSRGTDRLEMLLEWCFGTGAKGYTPVGRVNGEFVEHRVSWYRESGRLGLTTGHSPESPGDLQAALGIAQTPQMTSRCFGCHATGVKSGGDLTGMAPGVNCERCHEPGGDHVAAVKGRKTIAGTLVNPRKMNAKAQVQLCAQCHRSPDAEFQSAMPELDDPASIRFSPVGFQASACFLKSQNFKCVSCHDPHSDLKPASDPSYTTACLGCHADRPKARSACKRALKKDCVACHMKTSSPLPNLTFTDHRIRVYLD